VAAITLASIRLASGDEVEFREAADRALEISPPHPAVSLLAGYLLIVAGDWQRGAPLLDEALPLTPNVPGWANVAYAFRYLQTQDYERALDWSLRSDAPDWYITSMTVAAAAALAGRSDIAEREAKHLLELYPDFERTGREQLGKWGMDATLLTRLLDGLRLAGLNLA
jgi:tetratricopeptide (TPR) repeat protein